MNLKSQLYGTSATITLLLSCFAMSAPAALAQNTDTIETVVVLGVRGAEQKAIDVKRNSVAIVDSIVAEDIGKLPDSTISDSLQRIPGVQIRRDAGEGSTINIRGLSQVAVQMNGEEFLSANSITTVQPNFGDIPSQLFSGADVIKSPTADTLNAGITGTVNLHTRRPFDLPTGTTASLSADGNWGAKTHQWDPQVNGLVAYHGAGWGVLASAAYSDNTLANYYNGVNGNDGWTGYKTDISGKNYFSYEGHSAYNRQTERKRLGLSLSGQYDFGNGLYATVDGFYTKQTQYNRTVGLTDESKWQSWNAFTPLAATDTGATTTGGTPIYTVQSYQLNMVRLMSYTSVDRYDTYSNNVNFELNYDNGGKFSAHLRAAYGNASQHYSAAWGGFSLANDTQWLTEPSGVYPGSSYSAPGCVYVPAGTQCVNPTGYSGAPAVTVSYGSTQTWGNLPTSMGSISNYNVDGLSSENEYDRSANMRIVRAEAKYIFSDNFNIEGGFRYSNRGAANNQYNLFAPEYAGNGATSASGCMVKWHSTDVVLNASTCSASDGNGHYYTALGAMPLSTFGKQAIRVTDFGPVKGVDGVWALDPHAMDNPHAFMESQFPGETKVTDPGSTYVVSTNQYSEYVQGNFEGTTGFPYHANIGVRMIHTDLNVIQHKSGDALPYSGVSTDAGTVQTKRSFVDILPSANISFDMRDDLKFRFAYAKTMTMLDLQQWGGGMTPYYALNSTSGHMEVTGANSLGNPKLNPWRSNNFDAAVEWYVAPGSMLNVGVFMYKVDSFIESGKVQMDLADADGGGHRVVPVNTNIQGNGGTLEGVEVGWKQAFDFLPGVWRGLGFEANYTYSPSDSGRKDMLGRQVPFQDNSIHQINMVLWYQLDDIQARLAYNYRSARAVDNNDIWGSTVGMEVYQKSTGYLDASVSYDITPNVTAYLQGSNLTGENENYYFQWKNQYLYQNSYEQRVTVGVRARL